MPRVAEKVLTELKQGLAFAEGPVSRLDRCYAQKQRRTCCAGAGSQRGDQWGPGGYSKPTRISRCSRLCGVENT